jgi:AhpC/TSA family
MTRTRNFLPLAGFVVCAVALLSYPLFFYRFPITRDVPWVSWLLFAAGLAMVVTGILRAFRQPDRYRGRVMGPVFGVLSLAVLGMFLFMTLVFSKQLPAGGSVAKVGGKAPDFTLQDTQGRPVRLYEILQPRGAGASGSWALLIFYRGYW